MAKNTPTPLAAMRRAVDESRPCGIWTLAAWLVSQAAVEGLPPRNVHCRPWDRATRAPFPMVRRFPAF